jgi:tetratricopeptide (TPR) repeat protein/transglutaminase-like putative cysteine protease
VSSPRIPGPRPADVVDPAKPGDARLRRIVDVEHRGARGILLVLALLVVLSPGLATAEVGQRWSRLTRLSEEVARGGMPLGYVPLRQLWGEWDQGDPVAVEESLRGLTGDRRVAAPLRVYAGLLEAYARRRRGDLAGAKRRVKDLGFVGRWIVTGPFDNEGKGGFDRAFGPEEEIAEPLSMGRTYDGKERQVGNRLAPDVFQYGWVDLGAMVRPQEKVCAYATTFVRDQRAKAAPRPFSVWIGSSGASKVFFDGAVVLKDAKYRDLDSDRFGVTLAMTNGWHRLTVKVCGDEDPPMFTLRLADPTGAPDPELEADPDPAHAKEASSVRFHKENKPPPPTLGGPVPAFDKLVARDDAASLEAYARYLVLTSSDDPAEHRARDLARRAAEKAPTIQRCLLAGELAENRNQRAVWIDRAEDLVRKGGKGGVSLEDRIFALLARAAHARGGANWRDAIPYYDKILALDPDNVPANLARVELYSEAGLRETALASLDRTLARRPRSVALLRATTAALRELERTTEAAELIERYATLRFDDTTVATDRIELALARREKDLANRWVERLLETNPDSARAHAAAAKAYISLGDRPKAIATHRRVLDLAPEDVPTLRALADVYALGGQTDEQIRLLKKVLEIRPQEKDVREYVAHTEPSRPRSDEVYARPSAEFLKLRDRPKDGRSRRTFVDLQVTTVFANGLASRFHQVVFQPLTDAGAAEGREYGFSFEADSETVQLRGAKIYRKGGQVDEAIESGEGPADNPALAMYTSSRNFYVRFPRLDPGDVVELQYRVEDIAHRNAFADYFGEVTYMQSTEPIAHSEYVLITPKSRNFFFNKPKIPGLTQKVEEKGNSRIWRFTADNVPPLDPEPMMPPLAEALGHVHVSTYKSWDDMGRWYWGLVRDQFVADDEVRRRVAEITKGLTDDKAKVRAIYDFVVQKTRYVALEFGIHGFKPYRCAQIFARGFGDCKDKATLIVTMLKEAGIPATIVILRTGHRGDFETDVASLAPFDHAIAYVPSMDLYLDGTAEFTGSTELPAMDRGALGLQINEGKPKLVHLPEPSATETLASKHTEATVAADGSAQIDWRVDVAGSSASAWRQRYHAKATQKQRVQEDLAGEVPGLEVLNVGSNDLDDIEQKVQIKAKAKAPSYARRDGDSWTVPVGAREHMVRTWTPLSGRRRDMRLFTLSTQENETIVRLPQGAKVLGAPHAAEGKTAFGTFKVETETNGNVVRVKTSVAVTKPRILANEYGAFRAFCEQADRELGQTLTYTVAK